MNAGGTSPRISAEHSSYSYLSALESLTEAFRSKGAQSLPPYSGGPCPETAVRGSPRNGSETATAPYLKLQKCEFPDYAQTFH